MQGMTRRGFVRTSAASAATATLAGGLIDTTPGTAAAKKVVPLPSAEHCRADYQRMVDFGARIPGTPAHDAYCDYLEREFVKAGLSLVPCDEYAFREWHTEGFGLDVLGGADAGPVKVATSIVRSAATPAEGITAPLVYQAAGSAPGSIVVVDVPIPAPATAAVFLPLSTYRHWPGHTDADWAAINYSRAWLGPWPDLQPFADQGAKAVVFIVDASFDNIEGNFSPHTGPDQSIPGLVVDRETGAKLRAIALTGAQAKLTLDAPRRETSLRSITAVLPGESDEVVIVNTHTDGQNAVEENGSIALLHLARHFASLPVGQRPKRTLVFAAWPAHMQEEIPQAEGWIAAHPDLIERAVGAVTIEHLGCTEWLDNDASKGYHGTGENEIYGIWTTQGPTFDFAREALIKADLYRHALCRPPKQITVGAAFHDRGVPHVGGIAGPTYLLVVSENGELEKLDFDLAARQTAFYADIVSHFDQADAAALKTGDPTLGANPPSADNPSTPAACGPSEAVTGAGLRARFFGRRHGGRGVLVTLAAPEGALSGVTVELRRGKRTVARSGPIRVTMAARRVVLRRHRAKRFAPGTYHLVIRRHGKVLVRRTVHLGR